MENPYLSVIPATGRIPSVHCAKGSPLPRGWPPRCVEIAAGAVAPSQCPQRGCGWAWPLSSFAFALSPFAYGVAASELLYPQCSIIEAAAFSSKEEKLCHWRFSIDYWLLTIDYFYGICREDVGEWDGIVSTKNEGNSIDYFLLTNDYFSGIFRPNAQVAPNKNEKIKIFFTQYQ